MLSEEQLDVYREDFKRLVPDACFCPDSENLNLFISYVYSQGYKTGEYDTEKSWGSA